ncbi:MAG: Fic family protein, partial [Thermodesulfobacteriota bacterium]
GHGKPHDWQQELAYQEECGNRLIRIPTGFGKTQGVLAAWLWTRVLRQDDRWPRRLVWCLPMRVLVEQTEHEVRIALGRLGLLGDEEDHRDKVGVHLLMGGVDATDWHLHPEACAVLIGTQDMLLSRALNRGYAAARARWPMDFGLLNQDCLWVMDEVQLMDVGLATSGQLQAFRDEDTVANRCLRPCHTWWMSATLQRDWLGKSPETQGMATELPQTMIPLEGRHGPLWEGITKRCVVERTNGPVDLACLVAKKHLDAGRGMRGPTLVVVNRVELAVQLYEALKKNKDLKDTDPRLVHSRFRPAERAGWRQDFLNREACGAGTDRIIVATQVVEAGVDISAGVLVTELAPWASLVQRFGRAARWGGEAQVIVADLGHKDDKAAAPYAKDELEAAREALGMVADVASLHLEAFEEEHPERLPDLYPYDPRHLIVRHEIEELFDTTPDLSGADIDVSRFIRSGEERDLAVFWAEVPREGPPADLRPSRDALCAVPFLKARDWLCGKETTQKKAPNLAGKMRAWVWDWLDGTWRRATRRDLYPGQTVLVDVTCGGYRRDQGWTPESKDAVEMVSPPSVGAAEQADAGQDDESLSAFPWRTIATHGRETGALARRIAEALTPPWASLLDLAGRWHDAGKAFPAFQGSIKPDSGRPARQDLAKAPAAAWLASSRLYPMPDGTRRPGFRHELASALALFAVLQRHAPDHPALLGPWRGILEQAGMPPPASAPAEASPTALEQEILDLAPAAFDLVVYLVASHHGKIRLAWHACPADQAANDEQPRIRGLHDGEVLPALLLSDAAGLPWTLPACRLDLAPAAAGLNPSTGRGWTERVLGLLAEHGPFALACLEAVLRAADQRASRDDQTPDPLLEDDHERPGLEGGGSALAQPAGGGKETPPLAADPQERGAEHGLRGGTGGSGDAGSGARAPADATRHIETRLGILTCSELAPHLARNAQILEEWIEAGEFDDVALDDHLVADLHTLLCGDLTPQLTGWRRHDVRVGQHQPPEFFHVPVLMREYGRDLEARLAAAGPAVNERLLETLAFAEGRLLSIHPFADFNGRTTRVFLRLLLHRLDLPTLDLLPSAEATATYLSALRAADACNWEPLMAVWRERLAKGGEP